MEEAPLDLNTILEQASQWTFDGDCQILKWMQKISQNLESNASRTTENLDRLNNNIKSTNIALDNVANSLTALQFGNQFVECRVQDDDESSTPTVNEGVVANGIAKSAITTSPENLLSTFLDNNLKVLRNCHEKYAIDFEDSDDEDEKFEKTYIFKPVNPYNDKPLPHIFGSKEWCEKWHVGLGDEDQDNNYSGDDMSEAYSESTATSSPVPDNESFETNSEFASSVSLNNENLERNVQTLRHSKIEAVSETSSSHSSVAKIATAPYGNNNNLIREIQAASSLLSSNLKTDELQGRSRVADTPKKTKNSSVPPRSSIPPYVDLFAEPPDDIGSTSSTPSLADNRLHNPINLFTEDVDDVFKHLAIAQSKRNNPVPVPIPRERTNIDKSVTPPSDEQTATVKVKDNTPELIKKQHIGVPVLPTHNFVDSNKIGTGTPSTSIRIPKNLFDDDDDDDNEDFLSAFVKREETKALNTTENIKSLDIPKDKNTEKLTVTPTDPEMFIGKDSSKEQTVKVKSKFINLFDGDDEDFDIGVSKDPIKNIQSEESNKTSLSKLSSILKSTNLFDDDEDDDEDFFKTLPRTQPSFKSPVITEKTESDDKDSKTSTTNELGTVDQTKKVLPTPKTPNILTDVLDDNEGNDFFKSLSSKQYSITSTHITKEKENIEEISSTELPNDHQHQKILPTPKIPNSLLANIASDDEDDDFFATLPTTLSSLKSIENTAKNSKTFISNELLNAGQSNEIIPNTNTLSAEDTSLAGQSKEIIPTTNTIPAEDSFLTTLPKTESSLNIIEKEETISKTSLSNVLPYVDKAKDTFSTLDSFDDTKNINEKPSSSVATEPNLIKSSNEITNKIKSFDKNNMRTNDESDEEEFMKSLPPLPNSSDNIESNIMASSSNFLKNKFIDILEDDDNDDDFFKSLSSHSKPQSIVNKDSDNIITSSLDNSKQQNKTIDSGPFLQSPHNKSVIKNDSVEETLTTIKDEIDKSVGEMNKNNTIVNKINTEEKTHSQIPSVLKNKDEPKLIADHKTEDVSMNKELPEEKTPKELEICGGEQSNAFLKENLKSEKSYSIFEDKVIVPHEEVEPPIPDLNISKDNNKSQKYDYNSSFLFDEPPDDDSESLGKTSQQSNAKYNSFDLEQDLYPVSQLPSKPNVDMVTPSSSTYAGLHLFDDIPPEDDGFFETITQKPDLTSSIRNRINSVFYDDFPETLEALNANQTHSISINNQPPTDKLEHSLKDNEEFNSSTEKPSKDNNDSLLESLSKKDDNNSKALKRPISKLQLPNININVETLLPFKGVMPSTSSKTTLQKLGSKLESDPQSKIEKENHGHRTSSETSHILPNVNKNRVRAPVNRRPSSRKARQESYRTSLMADHLLNDNDDEVRIEEKNNRLNDNKLITPKEEESISEFDNVKSPLSRENKSIQNEKLSKEKVNIVSEPIIKSIAEENVNEEKVNIVSELESSKPIVKSIPGEKEESEKINNLSKGNLSIPKLDNDSKLTQSTKETTDKVYDTTKTSTYIGKSPTQEAGLLSQPITTSTPSLLNVLKSEKVLKTNSKLLFTDSESDDDLFSKLQSSTSSKSNKIETSKKVSTTAATSTTNTLEARKPDVNKQPQVSLFGDESDDEEDFLTTTLKSKIVPKPIAIKAKLSKSIFSDSDDSDGEDLFKGKTKVSSQQRIVTETQAPSTPKDSKKQTITDNPLADLL